MTWGWHRIQGEHYQNMVEFSEENGARLPYLW